MNQDWFADAPQAFRDVSVPIFAILAICIVVFGAMAIYRVATGKSLGRNDEDE